METKLAKLGSVDGCAKPGKRTTSLYLQKKKLRDCRCRDKQEVEVEEQQLDLSELPEQHRGCIRTDPGWILVIWHKTILVAERSTLVLDASIVIPDSVLFTTEVLS